MRALRIMRAGLLAGVALGAVAATTACDPVGNVNSTPTPGYVICDDTANAAACPATTANVVVDNAS